MKRLDDVEQKPDDDQDLQSSSAATWRFKKHCIMSTDVAVEFLVKFINGKKSGGVTCGTGCRSLRSAAM